MTPPPADVAAGRLPRAATPRVPRRVSGPARPARRRAPAVRTGARAGLLARLRAVPDARLLDRLVRGRGWIAIVGVALIGIVFLQVSLLNLNAGISRAVTSAETLERQNATLRESIAQLDTGERISDAATEAGMVMPSAGEVTFLDARRADGRKAAAAVRPPKPVASTATTGATPPAAGADAAAGTGAAATGTAAAGGAAGAGAAATGATTAGAAGTGAAGASAGATGAGAAATGAATAGAAGAGNAAPPAADAATEAGAAAPGGAAATSSAPSGAADPAPPAAGAAGPGAGAATGTGTGAAGAAPAAAATGTGAGAAGTGGAATGG